MDYVIYTVGNSAFLGAILNGVAAITTSDSFATLISIGMLFGVFYCCWECVFNATRSFNIQHMLVAICVYLCMFGPTRTVIIQDVYNAGTGDVVVDNIPLGVAASGSIVSRIGYRICVLIETAYHPAQTVATVYQGGFAEPLRILNEVRTFDFGPKAIKAMNDKLGTYTPYNSTRTAESDIRQAISNYIRDCTYPEIQMGLKSADSIKTANADSEPLKSLSTAYHTYFPIAINSGLSDPQTFSCAKGYDALKNKIDALLETSEVQQAVAKGIGGSLIRGTNSTNPNMDNLNAALYTLGLTGLDAQKVTKNRVVNSVLDSAAAGHFKTLQDTATAVATMSAIDQRNIQWASEGTMFTQSMHALMTFIEGFCYAIMPIMAFVFVMGAMGMRIVGKYFQVIIWIQLWYPIMAIVNLYVISSTRTALKPYATSTSFYDVGQLFHEVETHLGVAGLMLGATPLLALLIITGSSMAFTAIAGRMGGQDHFNEKNIQPDAMNVAPLNQISPYANTNVGIGTRLSGTESLVPRINIGAAQEGAVQYAEQRVKETSSTVSKQLAKEMAEGTSTATTSATAKNVGAQLAATNSVAYSAAASLARKMGFASGKDGSVTHEDAGKVAVMAEGGFSFGGLFDKSNDKGGGNKTSLSGGLKIGAGGKGELTSSDGVKVSFTAKEDITKDDVAKFDSLKSANLSSAISTGVNKTYSETDAKTRSELDKTTLGKSMAESVKASESLSKSQRALDTLGRTYSVDAAALANKVDAWLNGNSTNALFARDSYDRVMQDNSIPAEKRIAMQNAFKTQFGISQNETLAKAIAYMDFASDWRNGRLGDLQSMLHGVGITSFVGENANFTKEMPKPEAVGNVGPITGYTGAPVKPEVDNRMATNKKQVENSTAEADETLNKTGGSTEVHHAKGKTGVQKQNLVNQASVRHQQFKSLEGTLQNARAITRASGYSGNLDENAKFKNITVGMPKDSVTGVRDFLAANGRPQNDSEVYQFGKKEYQRDMEKRMHNDVVNAYKAHYGKDFSEEKYAKDIKKTEEGIREIAKHGYSDESAIQIQRFFQHAYGVNS